MRNVLLLAACGAALVSGAPALAQSAPATPIAPGVVGTVQMNLSADVAEICGAVDFLNPVPLDFGTLSSVATNATVTKSNGVSIICNDAAGGTVTVTSANSGKLLRNGTLTGQGNEIGYTLEATGGSGLAIPAGSSLSSPISRAFNGSNAFRQGQSVTYRFTTNGVLESNVGTVNEGERTTVFAGNYTDTVLVSVTSN